MRKIQCQECGSSFHSQEHFMPGIPNLPYCVCVCVLVGDSHIFQTNTNRCTFSTLCKFLFYLTIDLGHRSISSYESSSFFLLVFQGHLTSPPSAGQLLPILCHIHWFKAQFARGRARFPPFQLPGGQTSCFSLGTQHTHPLMPKNLKSMPPSPHSPSCCCPILLLFPTKTLYFSQIKIAFLFRL